MSTLNKISDDINLLLAWQKLKRTILQRDSWFDYAELYRFESNLKNELLSIQNDILNNKYRLSPIKPIAFPKQKKKEEENIVVRQAFNIEIRDQIVWLAVLNIIGPSLDYKMPFWSFGNRLYRSTWYEHMDPDNEKSKVLRMGWYRNSSSYIYRKWNQSWPRYKKNIAITIKVMAKNRSFISNLDNFKKKELINISDLNEFENNSKLPENLQNKYWQKEYWDNRVLSGHVYWASIDFTKFYPNINVEGIKQNIREYLDQELACEELFNLFDNLFNFPLDTNGWSEKELESISLTKGQESYIHLPTGLLVSGFLANIGLLNVDNMLNEKMKRENIAHFRFVDDHIVLSDNFEGLLSWIEMYKELLNITNIGASINANKLEPKELKYIFGDDEYKKEDDLKKKTDKRVIKKACKLDTKFPSPLMTQTLNKISMLNQIDINLLDEVEQKQVISDLEHLMLADITDQEIRKDTRISFAASKIISISTKKIHDISKLYEVFRKWRYSETKLEELKKNKKEQKTKFYNEEIIELNKSIKAIKIELKNETSIVDFEEKKFRNYIFELLIKAVKDNYSKTKLWKKIVEYCYYVGYENIEKLFDAVDELIKNKEIDGPTSDYIKSILYTNLSYCIFDIVRTKDDSRFSLHRMNSIDRFTTSVLSKRLLNKLLNKSHKCKYYYSKSERLFRFALGCLIAYKSNNKTYNREVTNSYNLFTFKNEISWFSNNDERIGYYWLLLNKTQNISDETPNLFWRNIAKCIDAKKTESWEILSLFPKHLPIVIRENLNDYKRAASKYFANKGWYYEVTNKYPKDYDNKCVTLLEWNKWCNDKYKQDLISEEGINIFDVRYSEWTVLEIVKQIANLYIENNTFDFIHSNSDKKCIHPNNYMISKIWLEEGSLITWEEWRNIVGDKKLQIELRKDDYMIEDFRYTPEIDLKNHDEGLIYGLGLLLICLLSKNFHIPFVWNALGQSINFMYYAKKKIFGLPLSSYTIGIIESCFSLRDYETTFIERSNYQGFLKKDIDYFDDTIKSLESIISVEAFKKRIEEAQKNLENYQITVQNHLPRQLIPINLIQLSRNKLLIDNINGEE